MNAFKSHSQAGQDRFVFEILMRPGGTRSGTFLDIGCGHPTDKNNSYGLESIGWRGLCFDIRPDIKPMFAVRKSPFLCMDARKLDWNTLLTENGFTSPIDYLSLDVDESSMEVLQGLLKSSYRFRVITVEHDRYVLGDGPRNAMREMLSKAGYALICPDVRDLQPFEDWWVYSEFVSMDVARRFICGNTEWSNIFDRALSPIEKFFDKIFIINLTRRGDRWFECLDELRANDIIPETVERFEGFDHPTNGHCGCTRSHRELIRRIADGPWNRVLVLEDDFQVLTQDLLRRHGFRPGSKVWETFCAVRDGFGNLDERFEYLTKFLPSECDVLYLGGGYGEPPISRLNKHVIRCGFMQTTSSYGITKEFAKKWTERVDASVGGPDLDRHPGPIDNTFGSLAKEFLYYVFQPRLLCQRLSKSDLDGETNSRINSMTDPIHENMV